MVKNELDVSDMCRCPTRHLWLH